MRRALLFVVLFMLVPMLLIFWYSSEQASSSIQTQVGQALSELNKQNHATIDRVIGSVDQATVTLMGSDLVQSWTVAGSETVQQRLGRYVKTEKLLADYASGVKYSLIVLDDPADYSFAPGMDVSDSGVFFVSDASGLPWLEKAIRDGGIGSVQMAEKFGFNPDKRKTAAFVRAVADLSGSSGAVRVVLMAALEPALLEDLDSISLPEQSRKVLTDTDGTVLAGSAPTMSAFAVPAVARRLLPGVWTSSKAMFIAHDSPAYGSRLIYEVPLRKLVGAHRAVQTIIQISAVCYFVVLLAFLVYLLRVVLRPMGRLARLSRSYEPGKKLERLPEEGRNDEIGFFYRSFYSMTERLNQLVQEKYVMEIKQKESELTLMHSQITPHLLYNTLDSVYWYGIRGGVPEVADMVRDLSTLLRIGLSRGKELITVREELLHVEAYLQLQIKRYDSSFTFRIEADENALECLVPKVTIQPLAENSILHGIGKMDGEGELTIQIAIANGELTVSVEDNGFRPVDLDKIGAILREEADPDKGFGIRNVHKRIRLRFGDAYGLSYFAREEGGTRALIRLPAVRTAEQVPSFGYAANPNPNRPPQ